MRHLSLRPRYALWSLIALCGALAAIALSHTAHADAANASSATFTVVDDAFNSSQGGTDAAISQGGTVTFTHAASAMAHNVDFTSAQKPTSCVANGAPVSPPYPASPSSGAWSVTCTFATAGTYSFVCDEHSFMVGTIDVTSGSAPTTSTGTTTTGTTTTAPTTTPPGPTTTTPSTGSTPTTTSTPMTMTTTPASGTSTTPVSSPGTGPGTGTMKAVPFLTGLRSVRTIASTVPSNGDINPYGIALVPTSTGSLKAGDVLVSNFNDKANNQGTGTTIVQMSLTGKRSVFATVTASSLPSPCPGGVGLTTALSILPGGYVVVGSLPTTNGKSATAKYGCLIVLNSRGHAVSVIAGHNIQGPWDMTAVTRGSVSTLFVSNALNGGAAKGVHVIRNSTVVRITLRSAKGHAPTVLSQKVIASGIPWRDDAAALVIGPTGVALASSGTLYLADTLSNQIRAIPDALTRSTAAANGGRPVTTGGHLKQPLGLTVAPNGDIITTNAADGNVVETTPAGKQVAVVTADKMTGAGSLFGLLIAGASHSVLFVDDGDNTLKLLH